ncbi:dockerin type I domain-containing protein [Pseudorhodoferax sp.]|uniref:dockerin type I domain-containing protein n=1 Tax=Pseudorhodoferax sp. TaxID=1993553 RepID=UPI002DD69025|nr:dockerin type I domain-containing protein [Pseudorhodoferax sp.]
MLATAALTAVPGGAFAQSQRDIHLEAATRNTGGDKFLKDWTRDRYCMYVDNPALLAEIRTQRAPVPMTQIFDDVWFVGFQNVGQFILKNSTGFALVDTLNNTADVDAYTVPALQSLGIGPQSPLVGAYITHGHGDHDGGASRLRSLYGPGFPIYLGSGDAAGKTYAPIQLDSSNLGYQSFTLGGRPLTVLASPGHTPGTMSAIVPVRDNGIEHKLLMVGGTAIPMNIAASRGYLSAVERMYQAAKDFNAVGTLHPHGIIDGGNQHMADINARGSRTANPYIIGNEKLLRTVAIMRQCGAAQVAQVDATAQDPVWRVTSIAFDAESPSPSRIAARVQSDWGPVANQEVTFSVGNSGASCTARTNADGLAACGSRLSVSPRDEVKAVFAGSSNAEYVDLPSVRSALVSSLACDVDSNGSVNRNDISAIMAGIGKPFRAGSALDADGDGKVTASDARMCTQRCSKEQCAL